jgi:hypothetical protein
LETGTAGGVHKSAYRQLALDALIQLSHQFSRRSGGLDLEAALVIIGSYAEHGHTLPSAQQVKILELLAARAQTCVKYQPKMALSTCLRTLCTLVRTTVHKQSPYATDCERRVEDLAAALQNGQALHSFSDIGPDVLTVAVSVLQSLSRGEEAVALLEKHISAIETSDVIKPRKKCIFSSMRSNGAILTNSFALLRSIWLL